MSTDLHYAAPAALKAAPLPTSATTVSASTDVPATADFSEDPGLVMTSCANCGAQMLDRKCKLICSCGYFLSCSDYY
jgi:hypothetical protein